MPPNSPNRFEICADSPAAIAAAGRFADRIELCSALDIGGVTPDIGLMRCAASVGIETHVLIRGRSGDFRLSADELAVAVDSIKAVRDLGLHGVVIGVERDGALDLAAMEALIRAAEGLALTLHRVIDVLNDPEGALEDAVSLGIGRILTSGGAKSAAEGLEGLQRLHRAAAGRITIMAGGGVNSRTLPGLLAETALTDFHASCSQTSPLAGRYPAFGFGQSQRSFDPAEAQRIATILRSPAESGPVHV